MGRESRGACYGFYDKVIKVLLYCFMISLTSRRQLTAVVSNFMSRNGLSSSDESSDSDEEEEVMFALCELQFSTLPLGQRLNLEDLSPLECEQLFRYMMM